MRTTQHGAIPEDDNTQDIQACKISHATMLRLTLVAFIIATRAREYKITERGGERSIVEDRNLK